MRRTINFLINLGEDIQEKKYSVGFLLDLSGSMQGAPLDQVKIAINNLLKPLVIEDGSLSLADQVSIVSFHTHVQKVCPWVGKDDFDFFSEFLFGISGMADAIMKGSGTTALFDGMAEILQSCYNDAKLENERIILIFSDGCNYGSEKFTEQDVEKLVQKQNFGFILESEAIAITAKYSNSDFSQIFEKVNDEDYFIFQKDVTEELICNALEEPEYQQILISALKDTRKPARICSLYYREGDASAYGRTILQKFADLSNGIVFDAPTLESIPNVMQELFHELEYGEKSGIRNGLINRLKEETVEGNSDWFRVFSVNSLSDNGDKNYIENPDRHTIFNNYMADSKTRNDALNSFTQKFTQPETDIRQVLISNLYNENQTFGHTIQTNPIVYITLRGNDLLGTSIPQALYQVLDEIRNDPNDILGTVSSDYHVFIVLLTDRLVHYTDDEKKNLSALLNEINHFDPDFNKVHDIFIIGERNDHFSANPNGYKTLTKTAFEQLVIENLFELNVNQQLALNAYSLSHEARHANPVAYNRFLSIGNVTLFADREEFSNKISAKLCHSLLLNLYHDSFKTDPDTVKSEVEYFMADITFSALKSNVLQNDEGLNLLSRFDCPSALKTDFTDSWKEIKLKFIDQTNPGLQYLMQTIHNRSFTEYIQYLYFDVRNYVESCHAAGTFNTVVQERITALLKSKIEHLRAITDRLLHNGYLSSPKQAELWIEGLYNQLDQYIKNNFLTDVSTDEDIIKYAAFSYRTIGIEITDDNPETPLNKLKEKLENYPLPLSSRLKFYSLSGLLTFGALTFFYIGGISANGLLSLLIPLVTIAWGEYRISQNKKQLRKLINWFGMAHRHRSRRQALEFVKEQTNQMLIDLKNKIRKEDNMIAIDQIYSEDLTEKNYLDLFRNALTSSFPKYFEFEANSTQGSSCFNIDITKGFNNENEQHIEVIDDISIEKMTGINKISWNSFFADLIDRQGSVQKNSFPTIKLSSVPPDFIEQLKSVSTKPNINLLMKLELTEIIPERLYYLTLLDILNAQEVAELKNIFNSKTWHQNIDILVNLYNRIITVNDINFFSLWREVGFYQAWLNKLAREISEDDNEDSRINSDYIFKLWKKMYQPRKEFREKLLANSKEILSFNVNEGLNLWNIIIQSNKKAELVNHIKYWSFSPVYLTNPHNSYTTYSKLNYVTADKYLSNNLQRQFQQNIQSLLDDKRNWVEYEKASADRLLFNHFVVIPVQDSSLLKSLATTLILNDFANNESWKNYFLADFYGKYLKTKKQQKDFEWLFLQS